MLTKDEGGREGIPLPHPEIFAAVDPGHDLLIDDGRVRVRVVSPGDDEMTVEVINGGVLSNRKASTCPAPCSPFRP